MTSRRFVIPVSEEDWRVRRAFKVGETAWLIGMSYDITLAEVKAGTIGSRRLGKYYVIPREEIERYALASIQVNSAELVKRLAGRADSVKAINVLAARAKHALAVLDALMSDTSVDDLRDAS